MKQPDIIVHIYSPQISNIQGKTILALYSQFERKKYNEIRCWYNEIFEKMLLHAVKYFFRKIIFSEILLSCSGILVLVAKLRHFYGLDY